MKTLITAVEEWIDDRVWKASRVAEHEAQFDANEQKLDVLHEQVAELERRLQLYLNSPSPESDGEESTVTELSMRIDDMDSRLDDVESSLEDKIDTCDADEMVDIAVNDIDLESQIIDAVQSEINAIDFKVTVER
jgi:hypothetical protein